MFNIRLTPKLHKKAAIEAAREGITLNQFVVRSVENQLVRSGSAAYTVRDENGFTSEEAAELKRRIDEVTARYLKC